MSGTALPPFRNEPVLELRRATERAKLAVGLGELRLPLCVPVWIGRERREGDQLVSTDPGRPERVVAVAASATAEEAAAAVAAARAAFRAWAATPVHERAAALVRAAACIR
jgi:RHH-type proline utilization regulon transcriptional repressor/proline dehydrogenase/delta 1-pyrroline-5-carboxylate dehydrogenase